MAREAAETPKQMVFHFYAGLIWYSSTHKSCSLEKGCETNPLSLETSKATCTKVVCRGHYTMVAILANHVLCCVGANSLDPVLLLLEMGRLARRLPISHNRRYAELLTRALLRILYGNILESSAFRDCNEYHNHVLTISSGLFSHFNSTICRG